jgi:hypothetical protein
MALTLLAGQPPLERFIDPPKDLLFAAPFIGDRKKR